MPMEAGAIGIRPVNQPQRPGSTDGVQRREDGGTSSGFKPQTNVAIKTAIDDMAGVLSKISTNEKLNMERLPDEVSQVVKNVLQQAFSMESTLSQGIGSTLESQRFSMEHFARMLSQIGALAEKGFSMELSDQMELLLKNFKAMVVSEEGGNALEPVLLSKAAFELIDSKTAEQLPQQLYAILSAVSRKYRSSLNFNRTGKRCNGISQAACSVLHAETFRRRTKHKCRRSGARADTETRGTISSKAIPAVYVWQSQSTSSRTG